MIGIKNIKIKLTDADDGILLHLWLIIFHSSQALKTGRYNLFQTDIKCPFSWEHENTTQHFLNSVKDNGAINKNACVVSWQQAAVVCEILNLE